MDEPGSEDSFWNALSLPFSTQIDTLVVDCPELAWLRTLQLSEQLPALSKLLKKSEYTLKVARLFSPLLLDLTARWLEEQEEDEAKFIVFGLLVPAHEELYPVFARFLTRPSLKDGPLAFITGENVHTIPLRTLHVLLLAYNRLISAIPHIYKEFGWSIVHLQRLLKPPHPDPGVRLLAIRCAAYHVGMNEAARIQWEQKHVGLPADVDALIETESGEALSVWVLPLLEHKRVIDERHRLKEAFKLCRGDAVIDAIALSRSIIPLGGFLLFKPNNLPLSKPFVVTETTAGPLHHILDSLQRRQPVMVSGSSSSGKSALIEYLADCLHPTGSSSIITIHLADTSLDARSLFGSYISSSTKPGTFEWKDGAIVQAMRTGAFLVLDNIDKASGEVLGMLWPLVESLSMAKAIGTHASLQVFNRGTVIAKEGFALFATRSMAGNSQTLAHVPGFLGSHKWRKVSLPEPTISDVSAILRIKYLEVNEKLGRAMVDVWSQLRNLDLRSDGQAFRPIELRDLLKWCQRVKLLVSSGGEPSSSLMDTDETHLTLSSIITNPLTREVVFLDALSIFFGSCNLENEKSRARLVAGCETLAKHLAIGSDRLQWLVDKRVPEIEIRKDAHGYISGVVISNTYLSAANLRSSAQVNPPRLRPFALHRPSLNILASLAVCVQNNEPVLLIGETGTGKTTAVSHLASILSKPLVSLNLSHQTESSDLLGGYKPLDPRTPAQDLYSKFTALFSKTFSRDKNVKYEEAIRVAVSGAKWKRAVALWREAANKAKGRIQIRVDKETNQPSTADDHSAPRKRRKTETEERMRVTEEEWSNFEQELDLFESQHVYGAAKAIFSFVEGPLVTAIRCGHWVLLDEINLASVETLEAISSILRSSSGFLTLLEQGYTDPIKIHSNFRLFACMNPATDVGKKDLPPHIRSYLTEIYVPAPDGNMDALLAIVTQYIGQIALADKAAIMDVAQFYMIARKMAQAGELADGSNQRPHYSMRTLSRALTFAADVCLVFGLRRALWEGCLMAFSAILDPTSARLLNEAAFRNILGSSKNFKSLLAQSPSAPSDGKDYVSVGPFWLERGPMPQLPVGHYILTPSVQSKLLDLARIITTRRFPVLIEGPTSSGKTSAIEYLARLTGHRFVRINNHEHTDIQEYIGSYITNPETGQLRFHDGLLVRALREGHWIVLDELNLAPSDVLEALNRLLDDNRELIVPETGEVVTPHQNFMLFATQNPPGLYGGRKKLSRAFRNRFLEVHFQDVPQPELEQIIRERCGIAPSYAQRIVSVFQELQTRRQTGRMFETKQGFATLRDLFRWAGRGAGSVQELAEMGYMLIAEKSRREDDKAAVKEVIQEVMKVKIDEKALYNIHDPAVAASIACPIPSGTNVVWTSAMQRLFVLISRALRHQEPVLLVGDTGSGKTSVCELYASAIGNELYTVNCHQNTETADLLGGQRPIRNRNAMLAERERAVFAEMQPFLLDDDSGQALSDRLASALSNEPDEERKRKIREAQKLLRQPVPLFDWQDGPLVLAMRSGAVFLMDEISLADDSVLERLNSVLEPSRTLILAEMGGADPKKLEIVARSDFQLVATMNPGGDHGKKELSPALRNRFTEIWVPPIVDYQDRLAIVQASWRSSALQPYSDRVVRFLHDAGDQLGDTSAYGLRDLLTWVRFSDKAIETTTLTPDEIFQHSASLVVLDGLSLIPQTQGWTSSSLSQLRHKLVTILLQMVPFKQPLDPTEFILSSDSVRVGPFAVPMGKEDPNSTTFETQAPATLNNLLRILRASQLEKPILLEGSPGVGKTSVVTSLASLGRHKLCRINLSDQTDIIDLFGSDFPLEGGQAGEFIWKDAAFLIAMQRGDWVLLDEMNLAPQSILEGLNAVLDHRGTVFIPELGRSFTRHPTFRLFAAQNPVQQGGGRKGLPKSFVNRFTKVYLDELGPTDLLMIMQRQNTALPEQIASNIIKFNQLIHIDTTVTKAWGSRGSPWEFNLRDIMRWLALFSGSTNLETSPQDPVEYIPEVYLQRFRSSEDQEMVRRKVPEVFSTPIRTTRAHLLMTPQHTQIGHSLITCKPAVGRSMYNPPIIQTHLNALEVAVRCLQQGWLILLIGNAGTGKTTMLKQLSELYGSDIIHFAANSATDTADLLGGFEQEAGFSSLQSIGTIESLSEFDVTGLQEKPPESADSYHREEILTHAPGKFVWVDGPLTRALREGKWFVLDNANLCSSSVLDRLNSLCELGGTLTLTERGLINGTVESIQPHRDFRLFMTVDPSNGELSRAMRNRGIEIHLDTFISSEDQQRVDIFKRSPVIHQVEHPSYCLQDIPGFVSLSPVQHSLRLVEDIRSVSPEIGSSFLCQILSLPTLAIVRHLRTLDFIGIEKHIPNIKLSSSSLGLPLEFVQNLPLEVRTNRNLVARLRSIGSYAQVEWESCLRSIRLCIHRTMQVIIRSLEQPTTSVLRLSRDIVSGRSAAEGGFEGIKTIAMVFDAWCDALDQLVCSSLSRVDVSKYYTIAEISDQVCEIVQGRRLDYAQWRSVLQEMQGVHAELASPRLADAILQALSYMTLSSGFLMDKIWTRFKPQYEFENQLVKSLKLLGAFEGSDTPHSDELLHRTLDIASLRALKGESSQTPEEELLANLLSPSDHHPYDEVSEQLIILYPRLLSQCLDKHPTKQIHIDRFCLTSARTPTFPHGCTVLLKTVEWTRRLEIASEQYGSIAFNSWISSLWKRSLSGTEVMAKPSALISAIVLCSERKRPLHSRNMYISSLENTLKTIRLELELPRASLPQIMASLFASEFRLAQEMLSANGDNRLPTKMPAPIDVLLQIIPEHAAGQQTLLRIRQLLHEVSERDEGLATYIGWIFLGVLLLHLYIPSLPLDPEAAISGVRRRLEKAEARLKEEIFLHRRAEGLSTGDSSNSVIESLEALLVGVEDRLKDFPVPIQRKENLPELHSLCSELIRFHDQLVKTDRFMGLLNGLLGGDVDSKKQEVVDQDSWRRFSERIVTKYSALGDLVYPVVASLNRIRLGVSLLRNYKQQSRSNAESSFNSLAKALTTFPSFIGRTAVSSGHLSPPSSIPPREWSTARIISIFTQCDGGDNLSLHTRQLWICFEQLFGIWLQDKLKEDQRTAEESSLYKRKKDAMTQREEAELEEEFQKLFPEYGDILDESESLSPTNSPTRLAATAYSLFSRLPLLPPSSAGATRKEASIPLEWLTKNETLLNPEIDQESVAFRLRLVLQRMHHVQNHTPLSNSHNFYYDSNIPQAYRAFEAVSALQSRLQELGRKWPEQMVLQHLSDRCLAILELDMDSSLARILSALEQLVLQTEDWQKYADRENSVSTYQQALSGLIIDWRRLELSGWVHMLDNQAKEFAHDLTDWWFRLYENFVHACINMEIPEAAIEPHLNKLLPLIEGFITTSPLGQFASRLQLLQQFHVYIEKVVVLYAPSVTMVGRIGRLLQSISLFYSQFTPIIEIRLSQLRSDVDKEVKSFVQMASWKDINVLALKASAQRTHHQLHKAFRKFRAILQEPTAPLLAQAIKPSPQRAVSTITIRSSQLEREVPQLDRSTHAGGHLTKLQTALEVFDGLARGGIPSFYSHVKAIEDFCERISGTISQLQASVPPPDTQNKGSWFKALLVRKKRAFAELLKACHKAGLSPRPVLETVSNHSSRLWLFEHRAAIDSLSLPTIKMDAYLDSILVGLPKLQASLSSHSNDISTQDLTKLVNYAHSVLHHAFESRRSLCNFIENWKGIERLIGTIDTIGPDCELAASGVAATRSLLEHHSILCYAISSVGEILDITSALSQVYEQWVPFDPETLGKMDRCQGVLREKREELSLVLNQRSEGGLMLLSSDEVLKLSSNTKTLTELLDIMKEWCRCDSRARHLCSALVSSLEPRIAALGSIPDDSPSTKESKERPISVMLVMMQRLTDIQKKQASDQYIKDGAYEYRTRSQVLDPSQLSRELQTFLFELVGTVNGQIYLRRLYPFLQRFRLVADSHLESLTLWTKSLFKLAFILINLGQDLADRGFCQPSENGETNKQGEMQADGTGVGEGSGDKDVSDEIQDESQIEGLREDQNQDTGKEERGESKKDEGVEMTEDFDGALESVPDEKDDQEGQESDSGGEEEEVEDRVEELDPADPDTVDEKMWEGRKGEEDQREEKRSDQPSKAEGAHDSDMAAKENPPKESGATKADEETIEQQDDLLPQEEGPDTTNLPNEAGAEMEREYQEEDVLDLPDDMDMGQNEAKAEEDLEEDEEGSSYEGDLGNTNGQEEYEEDPDLESFAPMDVTSDGDVEEKEKEEGIEHNATAEAEKTEGQGQEDVQGGSKSMMAEGASAPHEVDADTGVEKQHMQDTESHQQFPQSHPEMADPKETGAASKGTQSETRNEHIQDHDSLSMSKEKEKAQRTLAEAFAEVQRRYQEILERVEKEVQSPKENEKDNSKVEYTNENAADVQAALAPAQEEEVAKLRDLNLVDEIAEPRLEEDAEMLDLTKTNTPRVADHESQLLNTRDQQIQDAPDKNMESAFTREDIYRKATSMEGDADVPSNIAGEHPREVTSEEVEARLVSWQNRASTSEDAYSMWRLYSSLTHELAWNLCEQLRLILEPTKATRLRGDYRTGKRLNMKKIIPYIASEYTKDKIWLRRTRPSQREYQILVALDDSRSMSESHSEHLAFETLALVSKALTRLEAGDVFVAKFGEKVELLHGVDDGPFNDAAGAKVIGSFAFDQTSTDVLKLVEASCSMLQEARDKRVASSSASDLWQLEIIISDGVCSNHDRLRAAIRRASEQKILIVFIIVDAIGNSPSESNRATGSTRSVENSILTMKQVKPDLTIERYLDTFPFEYYVVLRSVNALPDVLSSTLKQFFQRITEE